MCPARFRALVLSPRRGCGVIRGRTVVSPPANFFSSLRDSWGRYETEGVSRAGRGRLLLIGAWRVLDRRAVLAFRIFRTRGAGDLRLFRPLWANPNATGSAHCSRRAGGGATSTISIIPCETPCCATVGKNRKRRAFCGRARLLSRPARAARWQRPCRTRSDVCEISQYCRHFSQRRPVQDFSAADLSFGAERRPDALRIQRPDRSGNDPPSLPPLAAGPRYLRILRLPAGAVLPAQSQRQCLASGGRHHPGQNACSALPGK